MKKQILVYVLVTIFSAVVLFGWNKYASDGADMFNQTVDVASAKVLSVDTTNSVDNDSFVSTMLICTAEILSGPHKGERVKVYQEHNSDVYSMDIVKKGDKIVIKNYPMEDLGTEWAVDNYLRTSPLCFLMALFVILIIIFGRTKGLRTIISLLYTCISVFAVFIPAVLSGKNIYLNAVFVCIFIIAMTLLLVNGWDKKTLCALLGCVGGVMAAAAITAVFSHVMKFTGYVNESSYYLTKLPHPVDLGAIAFSAVIIGAVGAVMDVAMSMSSSLYELSVKADNITFSSLVSSGFAIGRDMMGTMANTLVLAYVGSSLSSVLLLLTYAESTMDVFNREMIAHEIVQAVAGSIGIVLTIPVTALVCGAFYIGRNKNIDSNKLM